MLVVPMNVATVHAFGCEVARPAALALHLTGLLKP